MRSHPDPDQRLSDDTEGEDAHCVEDLGSRRISDHVSARDASNLDQAEAFAREIGRPLAAHATIHWGHTSIGDDPDGALFAKVREGIDKWLQRQNVGGGLAAIWVRERGSGGTAHEVHNHMMFHLPEHLRSGPGLRRVVAAIERLIDRHGGGLISDRALKVKIYENPDPAYLLKGSGPAVRQAYGVPNVWEESQGRIFGKRCGTTENIGAAARERWRASLIGSKLMAA